jgi:hypothetical protein
MPAGFPVVTRSPVPDFPILTPGETARFQMDLQLACGAIDQLHDLPVLTWTRVLYEEIRRGELVQGCDLVFLLDDRACSRHCPDGDRMCEAAYRSVLQERLSLSLASTWGELRFTGEVNPKGYLAEKYYSSRCPSFIDLRSRELILE